MAEIVPIPGFPSPSPLLRLGFVGGGEGAPIGAVHANGARPPNCWQIVAGALSSDPERARGSGRERMLAEVRICADFCEMVAREVRRPEGIGAIGIATPNHLHHPVAAARGRVDLGSAISALRSRSWRLRSRST